MKKQFTKIKIAAENLSRSSKHDRKDFELENIEKQVDKYREVLEKMVRKMPAVTTSTDAQERDKRIKKNSHYKTGQALEESARELSKDMPLHHVLANCGELEKSIAESIVDSELETETEVVRRLKQILDNEIQEISTLKRNVSRTLTEYGSLKRSYEAAIRLDEPWAKVTHIKDQQEQCEVKLEKDRDQWAAQMFELIAKEDVIVECIRDYVLNQRNYHERALNKVNSTLANIQYVIQSTVKSRFGISLSEHLASANREISYILELCICCLVEHGLDEEGLLRVGCASTKLRRMKHALEAQYVKTPLPLEYQDPHVIGSILKLYLRELPEPLLTYRHYKDFIRAAEAPTESERMAQLKATVHKLPKENFANVRYLTRFLWLVTQHSDQNKMTSQNLAIVLSPNMLWPRVDKSIPTDYLGQVNSSSAVNVIVELLISHWDYFFEGEVDFFVTLQRNKLFVEGKSKSNSSNENLDRNDGDSNEHQRYGTIRRQKPCAPTPPVKVQNNVSASASASTSTSTVAASILGINAQNGETNHRAKELFPPATSNVMTGNSSNNHNNNNPSPPSSEKPEKPPIPKMSPQFQSQQQQQQQQTSQDPMPTTPRPVPMTRTQFFGLDNLPSPVPDRRSTDSTGSFTPKPDLPQKPKIPKRPMVLGLNSPGGGGKSDDECTITPTQATNPVVVISNGGDGDGCGSSVKFSTEKLIDQLRKESQNNGTGSKENNHNQSLMEAEKNATNANGNSKAMTTNVNNNATVSKSSEESSSATTASSAISIGSDKSAAVTQESSQSQQQKPQQQRQTPTSPVSPNMIITPKRPTVPAPPPPTIVKKQAE